MYHSSSRTVRLCGECRGTVLYTRTIDDWNVQSFLPRDFRGSDQIGISNHLSCWRLGTASTSHAGCHWAVPVGFSHEMSRGVPL